MGRKKGKRSTNVLSKVKDVCGSKTCSKRMASVDWDEEQDEMVLERRGGVRWRVPFTPGCMKGLTGSGQWRTISKS